MKTAPAQGRGFSEEHPREYETYAVATGYRRPRRQVTMTIQIRTPLDSFADWLRKADEHAAHRLELAGRAERLLTGQEQADEDQRLALAEKLERWRYQHLNHRAGDLTQADVELIESLDLAANELAGCSPRPARGARATINEASSESSPVSEAAWALDPATGVEELARRASALTAEHFGPANHGGCESIRKWRMLIYAPLYVSNQCINHCPYCGFNHALDVRRKHLAAEEAVAEAEILRRRGFRHILLVAGELPSRTTTEYFAELIRALRARGISPAIEIAPQSTRSYAELVRAGACGITLYQETYDEGLYRLYHFRGPKTSFDWRLEGGERAAEAGIGRLGLGILLGLAPPKDDLMRLVRHAAYLVDRFPDRALAFGLPRLHETPDDFEIPYPVSDDDLVRLYCALRVAFPEAELVLSTREPPALRARLAEICITQMSAGSSTAPGGYGQCAAGHGPHRRSGSEQFPISDHRTPAEVAAWLREAGFEPVWDVVEG